jgi:HlyD family secretion protein
MAETTIKKRKNKKKIILFGIIGFIILIIIIAALVSSSKEKLVTVQTEPASKRNVTQLVSGSGIIQPETKVDISAEISGEIIQLPIKEGQSVKKGDLLVKIKADYYSERVNQQRAGINYAQSQVEVAENNLKKAELELNRIEQLYKSGLVSQADLDNARIAYEVAQSNLKSANANVRQNVALLRQTGQDLSKATIRSPMNGIVTALNSELGERVVGTATMAGTTIMTISDLSVMDAEIEISETDITYVKINDTADIEVDAYPDRLIKGVVYEISNSAKSKGTGTQEQIINFIVKVRILDTSVELKPGMSCNADIKVQSKSDILTVPIQCITARDETKKELEEKKENEDVTRVSEEKITKKEKPREIVFVLDETTSKAKIVPVKTGISDTKYIEITEGLKPGDVIIKGPYKAISRELEEGTKVKVDNEIYKKDKKNKED